MKDLKKMIADGVQVLGAGVKYGSGKEDIVKLLDYYDYDFVSVDGQHSPTNDDYILKICEAASELDQPTV